ncbi:hypothetical protein [Gorillibacterium massiliense]|uniref:hypothetical protein n=1 Tax=Gorillibacterium massiliense TaxID=1280390 RepID=UPI0012DC7818|nr:hypothetical protein [Gorillibacterium massiliense]
MKKPTPAGYCRWTLVELRRAAFWRLEVLVAPFLRDMTPISARWELRLERNSDNLAPCPQLWVL